MHPWCQVHPVISGPDSDVSGVVLADAKTELGPLTLTKHAKLHRVKWKNEEEATTRIAMSCHKINS